MAGEMMGGRTASQRSVQGLGFASGVFLALDCMSTFNSSPWTLATIGQNAAKAESAQRFVRLAIVRSSALAVLTSWIMGDLSPLLGASVANADLYYVYWKARQEAISGAHG